jgi:hypothetical protein
MKMLQGCLFLTMVLLGLPVQALDGWQVTSNNGIHIYKPNDLPKGKIYFYIASGPFELNGTDLKSWLSNTALGMQSSLGKPLQEWTVKPDGESWYITNAYIDTKSGEQLSVAYLGAMLDRKRAYIITKISSVDIAILMKYGFAFNDVQADVKDSLINKASLSKATIARDRQTTQPSNTDKKDTKKSRRKQIREAIRVVPGEGAVLTDIELVWVYSDFDLIWGGIDVDTYLLFKDGTVYKDCAIPPDELNVEASKLLEPEKWSSWRNNWGTYQIKNKKKDQWVELKGAPGNKAPKGTELTGRYMNGGGSQFRGSWKKHITFLEGGRFELSSSFMRSNSEMGGGDRSPGGDQLTPLVTVMGSSDKHGSSSSGAVVGDHVGGGSSSVKKDGSKNSGTYEVNNYTITLKHDNGWNHTELFLYEDQDDENGVVYGNELYVIDN